MASILDASSSTFDLPLRTTYCCVRLFLNVDPCLDQESCLRVNTTVSKSTCLVINNLQPALSGVAIGAGWQAVVAYVNIVCYYIFGVPLGLVMGYKLDMGVTGIWIGMLSGTVIQTLVLFWVVYRTNWNKEASIAGQRIKQWGGEPADGKAKDLEN